MSELRIDQITGNHVIVAGSREGRPHDQMKPIREAVPSYRPNCPFCPGNEEMTPPARIVVDGPAGWSIRGFANKYPILREEGPSNSAHGAHEVIVESQDHGRIPVRQTGDDLARILTACANRIRTLLQASEYLYAVMFKNYGATAGASLEHPHSQIIAMSLTPDDVTRRNRRAADHYRRHKSCLTCEVIARERENGSRVVLERDGFVAFLPYASAYPGETWVVPVVHRAVFTEEKRAAVNRLGGVLADVLRAIHDVLGDPPFNYFLEVPKLKKGAVSRAGLHYALRLIPRISVLGGFELSTGMAINIMEPENLAERFRDALSGGSDDEAVDAASA